MRFLFVFFILALPIFGQSPIEKKDGKAAYAAFEEAIRENIRPELQDTLRPIVAAIRYAENGGAGKEFGILNAKANTYRKQAGWCAATVQKNWDRWEMDGCRVPFIEYLGNRYCPVGANNDPNSLNQNWIRNVRAFITQFRDEELSKK